MKQTAVEWLIEKRATGDLCFSDFLKAKEMEKEQIIDAYLSDRFPCSYEDAEQYYNETFNK